MQLLARSESDLLTKEGTDLYRTQGRVKALRDCLDIPSNLTERLRKRGKGNGKRFD